MTPADGKLYALRDVTATIDNIGLMTSSIASKKIAVFLDDTHYQVINKSTGQVILDAHTVKFSDVPDETSGDIVYHGDFSNVNIEGEDFDYFMYDDNKYYTKVKMNGKDMRLDSINGCEDYYCDFDVFHE